MDSISPWSTQFETSPTLLTKVLSKEYYHYFYYYYYYLPNFILILRFVDPEMAIYDPYKIYFFPSFSLSCSESVLDNNFILLENELGTFALV